jgi:hypothetical protein
MDNLKPNDIQSERPDRSPVDIQAAAPPRIPNPAPLPGYDFRKTGTFWKPTTFWNLRDALIAAALLIPSGYAAFSSLGQATTKTISKVPMCILSQGRASTTGTAKTDD